MRVRLLTLVVLVLASGLLVSGAGKDCTFLTNPDEFHVDSDRIHAKTSNLTSQVQRYLYAGTSNAAAAEAAPIPRKNFVDEAIFSRMAAAKIASAPLASDAEFLRRVTLDLTGRIPSVPDVDQFLIDTNPSKRDQVIDALIGSPEFIDKWTMFFGDLFRVNGTAQNINRYTQGRDSFYLYLKDAVATNKPYDQLAREMITAEGDNFEKGEVNWLVGNNVPGGPIQDTQDGHAVNLAGMFLGINAVDCLLCHDGARHLDTVNLWGSKQTRLNMWGLSAYFARTNRTQQTYTTTPLAVKYFINEAPMGEYRLNTTVGNRSARRPINPTSDVVAPKNPFASSTGGGIASGENRRQAIARQITSDIQFSRAAVNYIWEKFMVEALVSPSNGFDLARLDPKNPPPAPWTLQPTNPELLDSLAHWFQENNYDLRALMALITKSNAYQLSSAYPGTWDVSYTPYYARKYVRRLDAEEIHDAIQQATGIMGNYTLNNSNLPPVQWAMQFPDTREPLSNGGVAAFLNAFGRGTRDTTFRRSDASILQALNMMNNAFVENRLHQGNIGSRVQALVGSNLSVPGKIRDLFMHTLSRPPTSGEEEYFSFLFRVLGDRAAAENAQWVLLNKMDFLFNY
jgi:hypothetical protein